MSMNRVPLQEVTLFGHAMMVLSLHEKQLIYKAVKVVAVHFKHRSQLVKDGLSNPHCANLFLFQELSNERQA